MVGVYSLDIETTGLDRFKDRIICIGVYSPWFNKCFDSVDSFSAWYRSFTHSPLFVMQNGSFDVNWLRHLGIDLRSSWIADTRSLASVLNPRPLELGLEFLGKEYLGYEAYKLDRKNMVQYSFQEVSEYCLKDCKITYELYQLFHDRLGERGRLFATNWLQPATLFCADLEYDGVYVDQKGLESYREKIVKTRDSVLSELAERSKEALKEYHELQVTEVRQTYKEMYEKAKEKAKDKAKCLDRYATLEESAITRLEPFNWSSPKQLQWLLRDFYALNITNEREEKETTNEAMLRSLDHPVAKTLCDYREVEKLISTCIPNLLDSIKEDGLIHGKFNVTGTRTGRLSSSTPNLQQIPKGRIRTYIQALPETSGKDSILVTLDFAQIEVRIIAQICQETELINAFNNQIDPYSLIAVKLFKLEADPKTFKQTHPKHRDVAKTAGLSILYGTGPNKLREVLAKELGIELSYTEAKMYIEDYRNRMPMVKKFKQSLEQSLANQKICYNLLGRPFSIDLNEDIYMQGLNTLVQGSASDMVVYGANKVKQKLQELNVDFKFRMLIHDEMVIELPKDEAELLVREVIEPALTIELEKDLRLTVPIKIEYSIDRSWQKP